MISIITVTSINHLFLFSSETWDAALSSLSLSVLVMFFASFSDSFKYFHTVDVFAALVRASIWSRHIIVRYNLFGLFAYSAEHRKSFFCYFRPNNFGASLLLRPSIILPLHIYLTWHFVALLLGSGIHYHQTSEILTLYLFLNPDLSLICWRLHISPKF